MYSLSILYKWPSSRNFCLTKILINKKTKIIFVCAYAVHICVRERKKKYRDDLVYLIYSPMYFFFFELISFCIMLIIKDAPCYKHTN